MNDETRVRRNQSNRLSRNRHKEHKLVYNKEYNKAKALALAVAKKKKYSKDANKVRRSAAYRRWYAANREAALAIQRNWRNKNKKRVLEKNRLYREANRETLRLYARRYYQAHRTEILRKAKNKADKKQENKAC